MSVPVRKGRGRTITRQDEQEYLFWLERCGSTSEAATLARVSYEAMKKRRQRNKRLRDAWDLVLENKLKARVELFFACLAKTGKVRAAYLACELTEGWFYSQMLRSPAFKARVQALAARKPNECWEKAVEMALSGEDPNLLIKVLDRFEGVNQPKPPKGG